ncbi:MAG: hypothetical protein ACE5JK_06825, partial [Candidatus Omnitrophota bacterium]
MDTSIVTQTLKELISKEPEHAEKYRKVFQLIAIGEEKNNFARLTAELDKIKDSPGFYDKKARIAETLKPIILRLTHYRLMEKERLISAIQLLIHVLKNTPPGKPEADKAIKKTREALTEFGFLALQPLIDSLKEIDDSSPNAEHLRTLIIAIIHDINVLTIRFTKSYIPSSQEEGLDIQPLLDVLENTKHGTPEGNVRIRIITITLRNINRRGILIRDISSAIPVFIKALKAVKGDLRHASGAIGGIALGLGFIVPKSGPTDEDVGMIIRTLMEILSKLIKEDDNMYVGSAKAEITSAISEMEPSAIQHLIYALDTVARRGKGDETDEQILAITICIQNIMVSHDIDSFDGPVNIKPLIYALTEVTEDSPEDDGKRYCAKKYCACAIGILANGALTIETGFTKQELFDLLDRETNDTESARLARNALSDVIGCDLEESRKIFGKKLLERLEKTNEAAEESKRINIEKFIRKFAATFKCFSRVDPAYAKQIFVDILNSLGPKRLESYFEFIGPVMIHSRYRGLVKSLLKHSRNRDFSFAMRLFELANAYLDFGYYEELKQIERRARSEKPDLRTINAILSEKLLRQFAVDLGIPIESVPREKIEEWIEEWNLMYMGKLFVARKRIQEKGEDYGPLQDLFDSTVRSALEGRFQGFITDPESGYKMGREVAEHNAQLRSYLELMGIDVDAWLDYGRSKPMVLEGKKGEINLKDNIDRIKACLTELFNILEKDSPKKAEALKNAFSRIGSDIARRGNKIIFVDAEENPDNEILRKIAEKFLRQENIDILEKTLTFIYKQADAPASVVIRALIGHLRGEIVQLGDYVRNFEELKRQAKLRRGLTIRTWKRSPGRDLFHGHYTGCCIALDTEEHPEAVIEYLIDQGIQIVEVV